MARTGRFVSRLLLAGALGAGGYLFWISTFGTPAPVDLLPPGAFGVVEVRDAEGLARRLSGTRFAAAFSRSATREWLESTEVVRAFDAVLSEVGRITGVSPGRGSAYDLLGAEAAAGWYPPPGDGLAAPWVAGGRLSVRAWAVAGAMRLGVRLGLGAGSVTREQLDGSVLYSFPGSPGQALHVFLAGRVLVAGTDRSLVVKAARAADDPGASVTREPAWQSIRGALPGQGELFVWVRDQGAIPGALPSLRIGRGSAGARLRAGRTIEIDVVAEPASSRRAAAGAGSAPEPLPGIALLRQSPLFLLTSNGPVPAALTDLLHSRLSAVVRRSGKAAVQEAVIQPGSGYAVVITDSTAGHGFFPAPRGLVMIGMPGAVEAAWAIPLLFPPGARTAVVGGAQALATRESIPLAGEFELWGAAVGSHLIFATDSSLIAAATADPGAAAAPRTEGPSWAVGTVATLSMEKLLPLLQRWGAPLSGLVAANWPSGPDVARDLGLLAAVGAVQLTAGSDERFDRAAITLNVRDLP